MKTARHSQGEAIPAGQRFADRAARRLNRLLDQEGYPSDLHGRSSGLAATLSIPVQEATYLLSGGVPWTWELVDKVCQVFSIRVGQLFDKGEPESLPSDTLLVPSVAGGESIPWRTPNGLGSYNTSQRSQLRYTTTARGGQAVLHVFDLHEDPMWPPHAGKTYVIETDSGFRVGTCQSSSEAGVSFADFSDGTFFTLPEPATSGLAVARVVGPVIATIAIQ